MYALYSIVDLFGLGVSNTDLRLKVEIKSLDGTLVLNFPPPPTDRLWMGFRPTPKLQVCAQPIVGERSITGMKVTGWIEKKMVQEFQASYFDVINKAKTNESFSESFGVAKYGRH